MTQESFAGHPPFWCNAHQMPLSPRDGELACPEGHSFSAQEGIVRIVESGAYASAFGAQWKRHARTQLDSFTGQPISEVRLRRCLGELWEALPSSTVLEVGCGAGRFTELLLARRALVTSVDLSEAVEANALTCPPSGQHRIAQADVYELPFAAHQFDIVVCLGVIQHTPDPERTIASLAQQVRPGGHLVIDHYAPSWRWYTRTAPLVRAVLRRLSPERGLCVSKWLVRCFHPLHERVNSRLGRILLNRISPITYYGQTHPELGAEMLRLWAELDTHDSLTDWYKHRRSLRDVQQALEAVGMVEIWCEEGGNGIEARARCPE